MTLASHSAYAALKQVGFVDAHASVGSLFLLEPDAEISPAYYCRIVKKRGKIQFGGGVGIHFMRFEQLWRINTRSFGKNYGCTLPLIISIDNYPQLIKRGVFGFVEDFDEILRCSSAIYGICLELPKSPSEFDEALLSKSMLGIEISEYLHIYDYHDDDNAYFLKSKAFIEWFVVTWPERAKSLYDCLNDSQKRRLEIQ